jgi:dienelactone hydrolase
MIRHSWSGAARLACVPAADVAAFAAEMNRADADWQLITYGAVHGFTHRHATPGPTPGVAYDPLADARSFAATRAFLAEALGDGSPWR